MALLSRTHYDEYEVHMIDNVGNMIIEYVLSPDAEHAAWQAQELSIQRNCIIKNVRMCDEW